MNIFSSCVQEVRIITMKKIFIPLSVIFLITCSTGSFNLSDRREGFDKGILRIYIRDDYSDKESGDTKKEKAIWDELFAKGKDRAIHLIISYIRSRTADTQKYASFDDKILLSLEKGNMVFKDCNDEYCEAFIDYQVKDLLESIESGIKGAPKN